MLVPKICSIEGEEYLTECYLVLQLPLRSSRPRDGVEGDEDFCQEPSPPLRCCPDLAKGLLYYIQFSYHRKKLKQLTMNEYINSSKCWQEVQCFFDIWLVLPSVEKIYYLWYFCVIFALSELFLVYKIQNINQQSGIRDDGAGGYWNQSPWDNFILSYHSAYCESYLVNHPVQY